MANACEQHSFDQLVKALSDVLGPSSGIDSDDVNPQEIERIMASYTSEESEWEKYALCEPYMNYTRNLVDEGNGKSNLLILVWNPGKGSPIHDHANAHCVMKLLKGQLKETLYQASTCEGRGPKMVKETIFTENEVTYIHDKIGLHKISNPSKTDIAVSLHLYTPPHAATFGFNVFNEEDGYEGCNHWIAEELWLTSSDNVARHFNPTGFFSERGLKTKNKNRNSGCTTKPGTAARVSVIEVNAALSG